MRKALQILSLGAVLGGCSILTSTDPNDLQPRGTGEPDSTIRLMDGGGRPEAGPPDASTEDAVADRSVPDAVIPDRDVPDVEPPPNPEIGGVLCGDMNYCDTTAGESCCLFPGRFLGCVGPGTRSCGEQCNSFNCPDPTELLCDGQEDCPGNQLCCANFFQNSTLLRCDPDCDDFNQLILCRPDDPLAPCPEKNTCRLDEPTNRIGVCVPDDD
ncbi:MAG: hypothetical protein AAGF12_01775 [Myxococcota bacterium]